MLESIPDVVGLFVEEAQPLLEAQGLKVKQVITTSPFAEAQNSRMRVARQRFSNVQEIELVTVAQFLPKGGGDGGL